MSFGRIVDWEPDEFGSMLIMTTQPFWSTTSRPNVFPWFSIVVSICVNACCLFWGGEEKTGKRKNNRCNVSDRGCCSYSTLTSHLLSKSPNVETSHVPRSSAANPPPNKRIHSACTYLKIDETQPKGSTEGGELFLHGELTVNFRLSMNCTASSIHKVLPPPFDPGFIVITNSYPRHPRSLNEEEPPTPAPSISLHR
jgi:hypothetical protein